MAVQFRVLHTNKIIEKGFELQKQALQGKIVVPKNITDRMNRADFNMEITCALCKGHINCLQSQCPVRYAHTKIINMLFMMDEVMQRFEIELYDKEAQLPPEQHTEEFLNTWWYQEFKNLDLFPYVSEEDVLADSLQDLLALFQEAIDHTNNPSPITGLDKIKKKLFGGN